MYIILDHDYDYDKGETLSDKEFEDEPEYWTNMDEADLDAELMISQELESVTNPTIPDHTHESRAQSQSDECPLQALTKLTTLFLFLWAYHYGISGNALDHLIKYLHYFVAYLQPYSPFVIANVLASFPSSLYM